MEFTALEKVGAVELLSPWGKRMHLPAGIFHWSGRAKAEAKINGTIGTAKGKAQEVFGDGGDKKVTMALPSMKKHIPNLDIEQIFPYAPDKGLPAFSTAWRSWILRKAGDHAKALDPVLGQCQVVPGITGGLHNVLRMFVAPGEQLVVPDKRWENYDNIMDINLGAEIVEFPFFKGDRMNVQGMCDAIRAVWRQQDRAVLVLNFPNNPTGYCPPRAEADEIKDSLIKLTASGKKWLTVIFDDAYEGYVYDPDAVSGSLFYEMLPQKRLVTVKLDGISKEMLWYGARIGAITMAYPQEWVDAVGKDALDKEWGNKFAGISRSTYSNCSMVAQSVAAVALQNMDAILEERQHCIGILGERYRIFKDELKKIDGTRLRCNPFQGGFFNFFDIVREDGPAAEDLADHLLKKYQTGTIPVHFGSLNGIRVAFCSVDAEDIPQLCDNLNNAAKDLMP
ncbi:MAG: aminotransferase class I/II-fold pyridoxal phosphate-dependent enzyme [bacterium]